MVVRSSPPRVCRLCTRGLAERTEAIGGDFFKSVPEGDLYLLRFILHDWDDADAIQILENCRRAMKPDARLVVIEAFFAEPGEQIPVICGCFLCWIQLKLPNLRIVPLRPDLALHHRLVGFAKTTEAKAVQG